jgi:UDP-glucuronate decarboxylase
MQALEKRPLTIFGDGLQTRSFCYVSDLVDGLMRLMDIDANPGKPINLGNPGEFTIVRLAALVKAMTGTRSDLKFLPLPQDDPRRRQPDISRAKALLGWTPRVPLNEGLTRTIDYFAALEGSQIGDRMTGLAKSATPTSGGLHNLPA